MRQLALTKPQLEGPDVAEVQRLLGFTGDDVDGVYGPITAAAVEEWKWRVGYPATRINSILGLLGLALIRGERPFPAEFVRRAKEREGLPYSARRKRGVVRPLSTSTGRWSEFRIPDAEGAPADDGRRYHAAKDWFAPGGTPVRAPVDGTVVEAKVRRTNTGQVFGGTVKIQGADGRVWVFRHVDPNVAIGAAVRAGQVVAAVTPWRDGSPHAHIELWKTLAGGYDYENMVDPMRYF